MSFMVGLRLIRHAGFLRLKRGRPTNEISLSRGRAKWESGRRSITEMRIRLVVPDPNCSNTAAKSNFDEGSRHTLLLRSNAMNARRTWFGLALCFLVVLTLASGLIAPQAEAQKTRAEHRYDYKVVSFSYNPGERLSDYTRAKQFERLLNDYARDGWEPVIDLMNRSSVQTVGGAVTTRDTITFVAFRRPR
jgi:hypothetical protein